MQDEVVIRYIPRGGEEERIRLFSSTAQWKDGRTMNEYWVPKDGINFLVQTEKFDGIDATRVTAALVNSVKDAGTFYYDNLIVTFNNMVIPDAGIHGNGVVLPGGVMPMRGYFGPDSVKLSDYGHMSFPDTEEWIENKCMDANENMTIANVGPWQIGFPQTQGNSSLDGSHGGEGVAPFQGGPNCWTKENSKAWVYKENEMLTVARRSPMVKTDVLGKPVIDPQVGWQGRTWGHEKDGWKYTPTLKEGVPPNHKQASNGKTYKTDDQGQFLKQPLVLNGTTYQINVDIPDDWYWCSFEEDLFNYRAIDHTHLHRETRAAAMLAGQDAFAVWFLRMCWNDSANWMGSDGGGTGQLRNLAECISTLEAPHQGAWFGGRGWAHIVRSFLYAEPYLTMEERKVPVSLHAMCEEHGVDKQWRSVIKFATAYIANENGVCHRMDDGDYFPGMGDVPTARGREIDLMGPNFAALGLFELDKKWKAFCQPINGMSLPESLEVSNDPHWSDVTYWNASYFKGYDGIRGLYSEFGSAKETEVHARMRSLHHNPWDYHIRPKN
tara:strand:+ start:10827 stop:12482 length:1656 start_codon:yes stop_codon:yes gene_type:complete